MKRLFFLMVFIFLSMNVFSQFLSEEWISTSEGRYKCRIWYYGNGNNGSFEEWVSKVYEPFYQPLDKPSNGQIECARRMVGRYQTNRGDLFSVFVEWEWRNTWRTVMFVIEFTSDTNFRYRTFMYN